MANMTMENFEFETLLSRITQETHLTEKKLDILFNSRGFFSALQASRILYAFGTSADKLKAIQIMEPRLCRMNSSEAKDIIGAFSIHTDKVKALEHIKKYLSDSQSRDGKEYITSAFPFEEDKFRAMDILHTVRSDVADLTPAGGHQGYAALGGLYTQCRPLVPHLYGSVDDQKNRMHGYGKIELPVEAKPGVLPSMYTGHPSYAYPQGRDYAQDRGYPGNGMYSDDPNQSRECPVKPIMDQYYPSGGAPPGLQQGNSTQGYQGVSSYQC